MMVRWNVIEEYGERQLQFIMSPADAAELRDELGERPCSPNSPASLLYRVLVDVLDHERKLP